MAHLQAKSVGGLLSGRVNTTVAFTNLAHVRQAPCASLLPSTRSYYRTPTVQDKASSPVPSSRPQPNKRRESFLWRRRERKEPRNRISTLALDPSITTEIEAQDARHESHQEQHSRFEENASRRRAEDRLMSRNQRRILLVAVVLLTPAVGRDVMEVIVPGLLGTIIFVGSKVKSGIKWVRRIGSTE